MPKLDYIRNLLHNRNFIVHLIAVNVILVSLAILFEKNTTKSFASPVAKNIIQVKNEVYTNQGDKIVYGYLPYWMLNNAKYLQYDKLTDIAYFGLNIDASGNFIKEGKNSQGYAAWKSNSELKDVIAKSKKAKVRVSITIIAQEDDIIDGFLTCRSCWETLVENTKVELKSKGITDVNVDFEHIGATTPQIANLYTEFISYLNQSMDEEFGDSKVVVATFADAYKGYRITNPTKLAEIADGLFIMAYDFHQPSSAKAGPVAPLYGKGQKYGFDVSSAVEEYKKTISPYKLIMGVPYYGYNFLIEQENPNAARLEGNDSIGYSLSQFYAMIKDSKNIPLGEVSWDNLSKTPYIMYKSPENGSTRVLHFENKESLGEKYKFAKEENLLGIGIWALGYDGDYPELWETIVDSYIY